MAFWMTVTKVISGGGDMKRGWRVIGIRERGTGEAIGLGAGNGHLPGPDVFAPAVGGFRPDKPVHGMLRRALEYVVAAMALAVQIDRPGIAVIAERSPAIRSELQLPMPVCWAMHDARIRGVSPKRAFNGCNGLLVTLLNGRDPARFSGFIGNRVILLTII